jgi:hypothetical protein
VLDEPKGDALRVGRRVGAAPDQRLLAQDMQPSAECVLKPASMGGVGRGNDEGFRTRREDLTHVDGGYRRAARVGMDVRAGLLRSLPRRSNGGTDLGSGLDGVAGQEGAESLLDAAGTDDGYAHGRCTVPGLWRILQTDVPQRSSEMSTEIVTAVYRAKAGKDAELAALIERHVPVLRAEGLATERDVVVMRSPKDGTFIEVFEWASKDAASSAHENAAVGEIWGAMADVAEFLTLADLPEATDRFPHFTAI